MQQIEVGSNYTPTAKGFHWIMALIWIAAWIIGFVAVHGGESWNPNHSLTFLHKAIASTVVFLTALRLAWRLTHRAPALPATMSPLMRNLAHGGHVLLYAVALFALPMSGWYWSSIVDKPILLAGVIHLPPLVAPDPSLKLLARSVHVYTAWFCGLLVAGHALVALKHHFIDRDDILLRMSFLTPRKEAQ
jgi:cytochrome b561